MAIYERGLEALQRHDYAHAAERLRSVLSQYPEERELHERVRLYLKICDRQTDPGPAPPKTLPERLYAATIALNSGRTDDALSYLEAVIAEDANHDHARYMLAVSHAMRGDVDSAIPHLRRAIELNPANRALAAQDPDLEPVRRTESYRALLDETTPLPPRKRARG